MTASRTSISISVIIPVFNAESYVERAIQSVLRQTLPADEILIVDDGSTDRTASRIKQYEPQIHYVYQNKAGANEARNRGIQMARGEWIAFLDADDEWLPKKLLCHASLHEEHPELCWSFSNYKVMKQGEKQGQDSHSRRQARMFLQENAYFNSYLKAYANRIGVSMITLFVKKSILKETGWFLEGQQTNHDPDLALRICYRYPKVGYIPEPMAINYFRLPGSITQRSSALVHERVDFLNRHLILSQEYGVRADFEPCAKMLLVKWLRTCSPTASGHRPWNCCSL